MKQERCIITMDGYGQIHFPDAAAKNIWMSTNELIDLFGIIYPTLSKGDSSLLNSRTSG